MEFKIIGLDNFCYRFSITKNYNVPKNIYHNIIYMNSVCFQGYIVDKILINNDKFSVILNPNSKFITNDKKNLNLFNISYKEIIISEELKSMLIQGKIVEFVNCSLNDIKISYPPKNMEQQCLFHTTNNCTEYSDDAHLVRVLIDSVATTNKSEIAITLNNCQESFYECLQGEDKIKQEYLNYIALYNFWESTKQYETKKIASHYLLIAHIIIYLKKYNASGTKVLFEKKPEHMILFLNKHLNSSKEELFMAIQKEFISTQSILKLLK